MRMAALVSDVRFQRFSELQSQPNLFRAVGRTYTETWHSAFLGWLLDPAGSHGLGTFPLKRFLAAAAGADIGPPDAMPAGFLSPDQLAAAAATRTFEDFDEDASIIVMPNENLSLEMKLDSGRVDVWIQVPEELDGPSGKTRPALQIIVEMKVDAGLGPAQCVRYADELERLAAAQPNLRMATVFITRSNDLVANSTETTDDPR